MICVYDKGNENYDGNGDVILTPIECTHHQVAAGMYDLTLKHPLDPEGKWMHLIPEAAIIRAPIQQETIETAYSGLDVDLYQTTTKAALREGPSEPTSIYYSEWQAGGNYSVGSKVSVSGWSHRNYQCTYYDAESPQTQVIPPNNSGWWSPIADTTTGSPVIINMKAGTSLYFVEDYNTNWYKMSTTYGMEGYIKKSQVQYVRHLSPSETQPRVITTQLFRVKTLNIDTKSRIVTVTAEHVSYDMKGVLVKDAKIVRRTPANALGWIENAFMIDYRGTIATNMTESSDGTYTGDINGKNAIYALLDPDKGVVANLQAMYRRDNWDVFVMRKTDVQSDLQLRYRKNMLGVSWNIKTDSLINRIVPVAKDANGDDFYLDNNGVEWVDSQYISQQPVIRMERIKVNGQVGKDDGTETATKWTETSLRQEMQRQAEERFSVDKVDQPVHEITIDFEQLGDTDEYKALKGLEQALMYEKVIAIYEDIQLSVETEVTEIEYDCIRQKLKSLKLSNIVYYGGKNVSGSNIFFNSITSDKLTDDAADEIGNGPAIAAEERSNDYTDKRVNNMQYSLKAWVTNNFQPIS